MQLIYKEVFKSQNYGTKKIFLTMKLFFVLQFTFVMCLFATNTVGQNITLNMKNTTLKAAFGVMKKQSNYTFWYRSVDVNDDQSVSIKIENCPFEVALNTLLKGKKLSYKIEGSYVIIFKKDDTDFKKIQQKKKIHNLDRVTGVVKDAVTGETLVGVNIRVKDNPKIGTATDINGKYLIDVPPSSILEFTYIGYITKDINVNSKKNIDVTLSVNDQVLDEVTVVGYGTQKKISLIGAQQTISANEIKSPVANLTNQLAGRIAGLVSTQRTGEPGYDDANIYIRGISTLTASMSTPLTLVDGVPRSISQVDPEDIESFSILKDASATAVYGVRGANGVILITTKSGHAGKPKFNFRYSEGVTKFVKLPDFVDAPEYMQLSNEAMLTRGNTRQYSDEEIEMTHSGKDPYLYPNIDWIKILFKDYTPNRNANANISGGSDNAIYYIGLGYFDQAGLYNVDKGGHDYNANTYYRRYSVTSNMTLRPTRTTEIKLGIQGYLAHANYPASSSSTIFGSAFYATPNYIYPKYPDGKIGDRPSGGVTNPYAILNEMGYANQWRSQLFSNLRVTQQMPFIKGLSITGMFSFDTYNYSSNRFTRTPDTFQATGRDEDGNLIYQQTATGAEALSYGNSHQGNRNLYLETGINYDRTFGKHDITAMLLFNQSDELNTLATGVEDALPYRFRGLAGRFTYAFNDRYFAEINFGYNGSENFAKHNRFGFFPSFGAGWVISNENFFKPLNNIINFMKLRGTWGKVGNAKITGRRFAYLSTVSTGGTIYKFGKNIDQSFNYDEIGDVGVDVTWETAKKANIGVDLMIFNNSLNIQLDVFKEWRSGIFLTRQSIPDYIGMTRTPLGNIGKVNNHGYEIMLNYHKQIDKDLYISALGNFSFNRNKVVDDDVRYAYPWLDRRGKRVTQRWGLIAEKLFNSDEEVKASAYQAGDTRPGDIKYKDLNGDGVINSNDMAPIGWGTTPEIMYGFGINIVYKYLSLSTMFQGATHVDAMISGEGVTPFQYGLSRGNILSNINSRWTEENPRQDVFYPRLTPGSTNMNFQSSSWWVKRADYLRLKNIQLTYEIPKSWLQKIRLTNANIFVQGVNVLTFSPFKLWDVENGDGRADIYPNTAAYNIGINFSF